METYKINAKTIGWGAWSVAYESKDKGYIILYTLDPLKKVLCDHQNKSIHFPKRELLTTQTLDGNITVYVYKCKSYKRHLSRKNSDIVDRLQESANFTYSIGGGSNNFKNYFHEWVLKIKEESYKKSIKEAVDILYNIYMPFDEDIEGLYFDIRRENILENNRGTLIFNDPFSFFTESDNLNHYIDDVMHYLKEVYDEWS